jgi:hypothetical protein
MPGGQIIDLLCGEVGKGAGEIEMELDWVSGCILGHV